MRLNSRGSNEETFQIAGICGVVLPVVFFGGLILAFLQSPWFNWSQHALSDLGIRSTSAIFFNSGVILSGILMGVFSRGVLQMLPRRFGGYLLTLSACALVGIGLFPENLGLVHSVVSMSFFILFVGALFCIGVTLRNDHTMKGLGSLALVFSGIAMGSTGVLFFLPGIAVPEALSCFPGFFWCMAVGIRITSIGSIKSSAQEIEHPQ